MCCQIVGVMIPNEWMQGRNVSEMTEYRTALVTGGAGFIGSRLVEILLSRGFNVVIVDNLSTGKLKNLNPAATFYHMDITHPSVSEVFRRERPELVFHLAAQISVSRSSRDAINDGEMNGIGTLRMLEAARQHGVEKIIYSSTGGALYGEPAFDPCTEDCPIVPMSPYGVSKYVGELYLGLYHRLYQLDFTSLRYGNVYGPRQDALGEAGVIAIFTQMMLEGQQPQIFGDGNQTRDFVYVDDVVEANLLAIERGNGHAYNIGTGIKTSINQIFDALREITKYKWGLEHRPPRPGDVYQISLDCAKAAKELGWSPQVDFEEGLLRTVESFREAVRAPR